MKMVSDVQQDLSTVANNTVASKLLVIYILHGIKLGSVECKLLGNELDICVYG